MALAPPRGGYTPEDLLALNGSGLYELVDGDLVEKEMGGTASWVGGQMVRRLSNHVDERRLGWVLPADGSYQCFPEHPTRVRLPDASFIAAGRLPGDRLPDGHIPIPPDLAVEVVSPNDYYYEVQEKVEEYLRAGVRLVWIIDPNTRSAEILRLDGSTARLREGDPLDGEDVLPGFHCPLGDLFPPDPPAG
jgi:Uma2 family endonuclease